MELTEFMKSYLRPYLSEFGTEVLRAVGPLEIELLPKNGTGKLL